MAGSTPTSDKFTVTSGSDSFDLDISGVASQAGNAVGSWTTNAENKIVITRTDTQVFTLPASWKFNGKNQLIVVINGADALNFQADMALNPYYETIDATLRFTPDIARSFTIALHGKWDLTVDHDLLFTPTNSPPAVINGFINSPDSKFIFYFDDAARPLRKYKLVFTGAWQNAVDEKGQPKEGQLVFVYDIEGGRQGKFELPQAITIKRTTNQLSYQYEKSGPQSIDFEGTLIIDDDFTVNYQIARSFDSSGQPTTGETTVSFGAVFTNKNFSGDLELALKKGDGSTGSTTLAIRGSFTGVLGKTQLQAGFEFDQVQQGQTRTTKVAFSGRLKTTGATVQWAFSTTNAATRTLDLSIGAQVQIGAVATDERLNLTMQDGSVQGVTFLLGVNF